jgi:translin
MPQNELESIAARIRSHLAAEDKAREKALPLCRQVIRNSATAIKAIHRQEQKGAGQILAATHKLVRKINAVLGDHPALLNSGFVHDARKEFAEGSITLALISGKKLPAPEALDVDPAAYLNGLGEAVGELRRYLLDSMRRGDFSRCEELLQAMDDIYTTLMTMDFTEIITHGLRRTTDAIRGIIERTRGDVTLSLRQKELEKKLDRE